MSNPTAVQRLAGSVLLAGLGQGALASGLSAYGNVANENDRSKGNQRMILESIMAALGAGTAAALARHKMNGYGRDIVQAANRRMTAMAPQTAANLKRSYRDSRLLSLLPPEAWLNMAATTAAAGVGTGLGGWTADQASDLLGLANAPGSWTERANDWNWDHQLPLEQAQLQAVLQAGRGQGVAR